MFSKKYGKYIFQLVDANLDEFRFLAWNISIGLVFKFLPNFFLNTLYRNQNSNRTA